MIRLLHLFANTLTLTDMETPILIKCLPQTALNLA